MTQLESPSTTITAPPGRDESFLSAQGVSLDVDARIVFLDCRALPRLAHKEFELLKLLLERAGRVVSSDEILERIWGYPSSPAGSATLVTHIRRLRNRVERDPHHPVLIRTLRGFGYIIDVVPVPENGPSAQSSGPADGDVNGPASRGRRNSSR